MKLSTLRCRVHGHFYHADEVAQAYIHQPDTRTTSPAGFVVHMRCIRCGLVQKRKFAGHPRPKAEPGVSLRQDKE